MEDYEKKYKETLNRAREIHRNEDEKRSDMEWLFPELKESEDEKIRKALIKGVESCKASGWTNFGNNVDIDVVLAWLKEQGKQKPIDYNKELKKCRENPLYFFDKYVKLEKQKPACSEEDERVKKRILLSLEKDLMATKNSGCDTQDLEQCIAWLEKQGQTFTKKDVDDAYLKGISDAKNELEKQGEQKTAVTDFNAKDWYVSKVDGKIHDMTYNPADKIEPKFKVGEWIYHEISGNAFHINRIENHTYISDEGATISFDRQNDWRIWTIQDAKDGDVLADNGAKIIFIFKNIEYDSHIESNVIKYFIRYSFDGINLPLENGGHLGVVGEYSNFVPATKEQRDLLFTKMRDAKYEWNADKKELKKIEQKPNEWSEEDEKIALSIEQVMNCASFLNIVPEKIDKIRTWLKSLKDRIGG